MKLLPEIRGAVASTLMLAAVCCGAYPAVAWAVAQVLFPDQANGSLITASDGTPRGSRLLGQGFVGDRYFHPRPSVAGNGYDAAGSSGSHLGPTSRKLRDSVARRVAEYRRENGLEEACPVPADAVTASGSGLDPHISPANAEIQARRVARARHLGVEIVRSAIQHHTDRPALGILGDPGVNVLTLNLALDAMSTE